MVNKERLDRFGEAILYLVNKELIDGKDIVKDVSEKMGRHPNNVRAALRGDKRYLTNKFIKAFCSVFKNVISSEWVWSGNGSMEVNVQPKAYDIQQEEEKWKSMAADLPYLDPVLLDRIINEKIADMYIQLIEEKDKMIEYLQDRVNKLEGELERLYSIQKSSIVNKESLEQSSPKSHQK